MSESSRSISDPLFNADAMPFSPTSPRQQFIATNKTAHMVNASFNHRAGTATPTPTSQCNRTNDTASWTSAMSNSTVAPTQTPNAAKQPAVAPPSLTLQIPSSPASNNRSNSGRKISFSASAQSHPRSEVLRSTVQSFNRHTHPRTLAPKPHYSRSAGHGNQFKGHIARPSHSNSMTWKRTAMTLKEHWFRIEKEMKIMRFLPSEYPKFPAYVGQKYEEWLERYPKYSPFVPDTYDAYLGHLASFEAWKAKRVAFLVEQKELEMTLKRKGQPKVESIFANRKFTDGMSAVLCLESKWSTWYEPTTARPQAPWPGHDEMDEEGNQRNASVNGDFGRFLPLPRAPANDTMNWKQRAQVMPTDFDEVRILFDCISRGGKEGQEMKDLYKATIEREVEGTKIAWANRESDRIWEEKLEERLNTGLSADVAKHIADIETTAVAKEIAIAKLLQEEEAKFRAEMLEVFPESFVNTLNYSDENGVEEKENKNKENKEIEGNKKDSKKEE